MREEGLEKSNSVKPKYESEDPFMCVYSSRFGVWRLHYRGSVVLIHDAKHYPEARWLEDFYRGMGINVYRINTDIIGEDELAKTLLSRCKRIFKH